MHHVQLLGELTILLWKKFDQLQSLRGVPSSKRWIASNNNTSNDKLINQFGSPLEALLFEESQRVASLSSPFPASGGGGTSTGGTTTSGSLDSSIDISTAATVEVEALL